MSSKPECTEEVKEVPLDEASAPSGPYILRLDGHEIRAWGAQAPALGDADASQQLPVAAQHWLQGGKAQQTGSEPKKQRASVSDFLKAQEMRRLRRTDTLPQTPPQRLPRSLSPKRKPKEAVDGPVDTCGADFAPTPQRGAKRIVDHAGETPSAPQAAKRRRGLTLENLAEPSKKQSLLDSSPKEGSTAQSIHC